MQTTFTIYEGKVPKSSALESQSEAFNRAKELRRTAPSGESIYIRDQIGRIVYNQFARRRHATPGRKIRVSTELKSQSGRIKY